MYKASEPPPGVRTDYQVFAEVAHRLAFVEEFTEGRSATERVRHLYDVTREGLACDGVPVLLEPAEWLGSPIRRRPDEQSFEDRRTRARRDASC